MALNIKKILSDTLLQMNQTTPLSEIRIRDIIERTGISYQTFYNHFKNKNALIQWIYKERIVYPPRPAAPRRMDQSGDPSQTEIVRKVDIYPTMLFYYRSLGKNSTFIRQACQLEGKHEFVTCVEQLERDWCRGYYAQFFPDGGIPENLVWAMEYYSNAFTGVTTEWILSNLGATPEELALWRVKCTPRILMPYYASHEEGHRLIMNIFQFGEGATHIPQEQDACVRRRKEFSDALLVLCEEMPIDKITIKHLLEYTGTGRQTFYRYFLDKNDLIQWTFRNRILVLSEDGADLPAVWKKYYQRLGRHRRFVAQAGNLTGQNCLSDYMIESSVNWWMDQCYRYFRTREIPRELEYAIRFHAYGIVPQIIRWAQSESDVPPELLADWTCGCLPPVLEVFPFVKRLAE